MMMVLCMCVLTDGDGVYVCDDRVETGCGTVNEFMDCTWYLWWLITSNS